MLLRKNTTDELALAQIVVLRESHSSRRKDNKKYRRQAPGAAAEMDMADPLQDKYIFFNFKPLLSIALCFVCFKSPSS